MRDISWAISYRERSKSGFLYSVESINDEVSIAMLGSRDYIDFLKFWIKV
jgi:hypothetical protein